MVNCAWCGIEKRYALRICYDEYDDKYHNGENEKVFYLCFDCGKNFNNYINRWHRKKKEIVNK